MPRPEFICQSDQTRKDIFELASGVWTAVGYAAPNVHTVEGALLANGG